MGSSLPRRSRRVFWSALVLTVITEVGDVGGGGAVLASSWASTRRGESNID